MLCYAAVWWLSYQSDSTAAPLLTVLHASRHNGRQTYKLSDHQHQMMKAGLDMHAAGLDIHAARLDCRLDYYNLQ